MSGRQIPSSSAIRGCLASTAISSAECFFWNHLMWLTGAWLEGSIDWRGAMARAVTWPLAPTRVENRQKPGLGGNLVAETGTLTLLFTTLFDSEQGVM